jgi:asparagine synthase (glutamine-hydrolysing)
MCGFVGGTDPSWDYTAALASIEHRGPDDGRLHLDGPVRVGFRRLSIIDLDAAAMQPMFADDGETWIVFNGEIYGFLALRSELERLGHVSGATASSITSTACSQLRCGMQGTGS